LFDEQRDTVIKRSRDITKASKVAIYCLHRGEMDKADAQIALALAAADELLPLVTENPQLRTSGECFPFTTFRRLQSPPYHGNCSLIQITRD